MVSILKIDDKKQMQLFINTLRVIGYSEEELNQVEQIIDIERIQTFSKKKAYSSMVFVSRYRTL